MNTKLLNDKIKSIQIPLSEIAEIIGISQKSLCMKISEKRPFMMSEVEKISYILKLSKDEKIEIFFPEEDDNSTH